VKGGGQGGERTNNRQRREGKGTRIKGKEKKKYRKRRGNGKDGEKGEKGREGEV
jgi:hypothetical protein